MEAFAAACLMVGLLLAGMFIGQISENKEWRYHCTNQGYHNEGQVKYVCFPIEEKK